jgi:hypothetical protein
MAGSIKFFRNSLVSFVQYKNNDDFNFVIHQQTQLVAKILDIYGNKKVHH